MKRFQALLFVLVLALAYLQSLAQDTSKPYIRVSGEVTAPLKLYQADLLQMKRATVMFKDRVGKEHAFTGVPLQELLAKAGVTMGKAVRGENLSKYLLVKCADNYEVLFSLAELDSSFTDRVIILSDESEGKPLPEGKGPFRLIVPGEKKPARSGMQVVEFVVHFAKD